MDDGLLTVEQAAAAYDVSPVTLRKRAQRGDIEGAVKIRGRRGREWRVPAAALEAMGWQRREKTEATLDTLIRSAEKIATSLAEVQRDNARLHRELTAALTEAARLEAVLEGERRLAAQQESPRQAVDLRTETGATAG